ncbi:hypothetical protein ACEPAG_2954 [Sanghuangporus baumii]
MATEHSSDPPAKQNNGHIADGSIDPSLVDQAGSTASNNVNVQSINGSHELPDDERILKRIWLTLLPVEQVIEILLKLDESLAKEGPSEEYWKSVRGQLWPTDLKAAVLHAALAKIVESSGTVTVNNNENAEDKGSSKTSQTTNVPKKDGGVEQNANGQSTKDPPPSVSTSTSDQATMAAETPHTTAPTPSITTLVPPLIPIRRPSPPTSTTTYQAAASASTSPSYPYQPYSSGSISYQQSSHHQPYSASYSPSPPTVPVRVPPLPPTPAPVEDEDDLPSYEEMLVQALTVHNDPDGTAPKQLFQWMAATYPLQANFRPSASQALQKAYKRGRFEKNSEGRYRLNPRWEGGNTSRRTTRRPQSYSKSVLNPSPSSHPAPNSSQFPPQHYTWTYGGRAATKSQSPAPVPLSNQASSSTTAAPQISSTSPAMPFAGKHLLPGPDGTDQDQDHESHRSCMEAAYSILQALNITGANGDSSNSTHNFTVSAESTKDTNATELPVPASTSTAAGPSSAAQLVPLPIGAPALPIASPSAPTSVQTNRAALQGSLALLAAQLAELADTSTTNANANGQSAHAQGTLAASGTIGMSGLGFLEGMGINFNLDLAQLGIEVEPAK